jgi:hypothetical protein
VKRGEARFGTKVHKRGREVFQAVALQIVLRLARPAPEMVVVGEEEGCPHGDCTSVYGY